MAEIWFNKPANFRKNRQSQAKFLSGIFIPRHHVAFEAARCCRVIEAHKMKQFLQRLFAIAAIGTLAACATSSPDVIQRGDAQRMSVVQDATV